VVVVLSVVGGGPARADVAGLAVLGGEDAVELVGAAAGLEGEAVEDAVSSCSSGAPEGLCELGQVGHWPVPFWGRGGRSAVASVGCGGRSVVALVGPVGGFCWSWWSGGGGASPGWGGRSPGPVPSHLSPIVPVTCDKYFCDGIRGGRGGVFA